MFKPEVIRVNISSSFMVRAACKECGSGPNFYYQAFKPNRWDDIDHYLILSKIVRQWIQGLLSNWYTMGEPRYFYNMSDFSFKLDDKSYPVTLHRTRGANISPKENVVEFLGCECGATIWGFNEKSVKNRPEIVNRKGKYKYPKKFLY